MQNLKKISWSLILIITIAFSACDETLIPKPRGFFRIALPETTYVKDSCKQFRAERLSSSLLTTKEDDPNWITLHYPSLKASLYLTYFKDSDLNKLGEDARKSAYKHAIKADDIIQMPFQIPKKSLCGIIYSIEGNAASPVVLQMTDSVDQFIHGALYFDAEPNADSLKPVVYFVRQDIQHFIESFEWTNH
ncbi:MAG: hypothetical protein JXR60_02215 [Bacteroidales bacterium]|nr:hypothetical protein [Bacteroidales bacterium]